VLGRVERAITDRLVRAVEDSATGDLAPASGPSTIGDSGKSKGEGTMLQDIFVWGQIAVTPSEWIRRV
jgi:hypothetical protein